MKFTLNKQQFLVKFSRADDTTFAELWKYDDTIEEYDCLNILAHVTRFYRDVPNKAIGRKRALAALFKLMNAFAKEDKQKYKVLKNNKRQRAKIWQLYFETHNKE